MPDETRKPKTSDIEQRHLTFPVELRATDDGKGKMLVGYAAVFNTVTQIGGGWWGFREQIAPGCFTDTIKEDDIRGLFNHDSNMILGRNTAKTCSLKEDSRGLYFEIDVPDTQLGRDLVTSVQRGDISGCSFAFGTTADEWDYTEEDNPLRTLKKVRLYDVGPVTYPAYEATSVSARSLEAAKASKQAEKPPEKVENQPENREKGPENSPEGQETGGKPAETISDERKREIEWGYKTAERIINRNTRRLPDA
ncbi:MAG: hypothetical protein A2Y76_01695 [Planctomycetes bacterium RBG_13_60_9]|nr:MAG: hypothetical protein A2Y76_01695 [Planctomycetes bacterium RBG_13_60_9]